MSDTPPEAVPSAPPAAHLSPRAIAASRVLQWYEEALRLFKRAPGTWIALALLTVATEFLLKTIPVAGAMLSELITPVVACGLVYAAAATDRGAAPSIRLAFAALGVPAGALTAVIFASLIPSVLQALAAWWLADVNVFGSEKSFTELAPITLAGIYSIGILASLPFTFVPFHALLERVAPGPAFTASWNAFVVNTPPLLAYAAASLVLLGFCMLTMGLGLMLALPLWAASSYAAWKDIFGVPTASD